MTQFGGKGLPALLSFFYEITRTLPNPPEEAAIRMKGKCGRCGYLVPGGRGKARLLAFSFAQSKIPYVANPETASRPSISQGIVAVGLQL
ncbi:MAG TPA: hypothetical protein VLL47_11695, partial [Robiginitalea sp.]|nr:hypothetical protein [Robiginitalea sp.]